MKKIDICYGEYASKWGLTDFYEDSEQKLREALASGEDFDTGWFGCKKEIRYARICRENGAVTVEVSCHMDDLYESDDLICDALWSAYKIEKELPEEILDSIRDAAVDEQMDDYSEESDTLPADASFEQICESIAVMVESAEKKNEEVFNELCEIVKAHVQYMEENGIGFVEYGDEDEQDEE